MDQKTFNLQEIKDRIKNSFGTIPKAQNSGLSHQRAKKPIFPGEEVSANTHLQSSFKKIETKRMTKALIEHLDYLKYEIVIPGFIYRYSEMDVMGIQNDRVIEFEIKATLYDYGNDFDKFYKVGRYGRPNKHHSLERGFLDKDKKQHVPPNLFYFVVPDGMLKPEDVPGYCGLLTASETADGVFKFEEKKMAPRLHDEFIATPFYKRIATTCYNRYRIHPDPSSFKDNEYYDPTPSPKE